jgi:hypothetical protein
LAKGEKGRGYGQNNHLLPPPPSRYRTHETGRPTVEGGRGAGDPGHGGGREVGQNEEEVEGNSFRSSPWSGTNCGGRSTAAGGLQPGTARRHWWWRWRARGGGGIGRGGAGRGWEPVRPFYRRGKAVRAKIFELQELRWPSMAVGRKYHGIDLGLTRLRGTGCC